MILASFNYCHAGDLLGQNDKLFHETIYVLQLLIQAHCITDMGHALNSFKDHFLCYLVFALNT